VGRGCTSTLLAALGVLVWGCGDTFTCEEQSQCVDDDRAGRCEANGFCSFPDPDCPSGHRYGDRAGDGLAGECVAPDDGTTSDDPPTTTASTFTTTVDPTIADTSSATGPSTTDDPSASETGARCPSNWLDCGFAHRRELTVIALAGMFVEDFPLRLHVEPAFDWEHAAIDGADVRFFADDGTPYPHEIERWITGESAEIWIRWPTIGDAQGSTAWMYYGHDAPLAAPDPADVWSNGYVAVWHMVDGTDSLGALPLEPTSTMVVDGRIGEAQLFDGTSSYMTAMAEIEDPFENGATITAWIQPAGWGLEEYGRIVDMRTDLPNGPGWSWLVNGLTPPIESLRFTEAYEMSDASWNSPGATIALDTWFAVGVSRRRAAPAVPLQFWIDGAAVPADNDIAAVGAHVPSVAPLTIGALAGGTDRFYDGVIDEVRIASGIRDSAWIAYEHASVADDLLVLGPQQSRD